MRIEADRQACTSSGMCALTAPDWFDQDEADGRVLVTEPEAPDGEPAVTAAAELCPAGVIALR
ncbi:ferredoxin [Glycomyces terrestris]|uniref:Ferredoxin n=1 Tax=Glycomyces terrestris TaxID=2493553 RepID=A0A426UYB8_9ACTN|nr:ferredoxin [Glycomyces terrestris]RRR99561.1 ferredoxin [Glycomyces terrestris]